MSSPRSVLLAAGVVATMCGPSLACKPRNQSGAQSPIATGDGDGGTMTPGDGKGTAAPKGKVEKIQVRASLSGVDDMFLGWQDFATRWMPEDKADPRADLQALLLQTGYAPSFLDNIDLAGVHAVWFAYPQQDSASAMDDANIAASVAVVDARKVIEGMPQSQKPQPLGEGMWELATGNQKLLMKESGKELLIGLTPQDIAEAAKLRGQVTAGRRVRARVWNMPLSDVDPATVLGLPPDSKLARDLGRVLKEAKAAELEGEFGTARDLELSLAAEAPFHLLGIEPVGAPRAAATGLEGRLPGNPTFVMSLSWGDPTLVHKVLRANIPFDQIPEPFGAIAKQAVDGVDVLLDQVASDIVIAMYSDARGVPTFMIAADVKDEAKTRDAMRQISVAIEKAVLAQHTLVGKTKDAQVGITWKPDGAKVGGGKADELVVKPSKNMKEEAESLKNFIGKDAVEMVSFVKDKTAIVMVGPGGKKLAGDVMKSLGKARKDSLAAHKGLSRLRKSMGGCSICISGDTVAYYKFRLGLMKAQKDADVAKKAKSTLAKLGKVKDVGDPGVGVKVEKNRASVGMVIPQETLFPPKDQAVALREVIQFVESGGTATEPPPPPKDSGVAPRKEKAPKPKAGPTSTGKEK
jgi:hypothetical protein